MSDEVRKIVEEYSTKIGNLAHQMTTPLPQKNDYTHQEPDAKFDPLIEDIRREAIISEMRRSAGGTV